MIYIFIIALVLIALAIVGIEMIDNGATHIVCICFIIVAIIVLVFGFFRFSSLNSQVADVYYAALFDHNYVDLKDDLGESIEYIDIPETINKDQPVAIKTYSRRVQRKCDKDLFWFYKTSKYGKLVNVDTATKGDNNNE